MMNLYDEMKYIWNMPDEEIEEILQELFAEQLHGTEA